VAGESVSHHFSSGGLWLQIPEFYLFAMLSALVIMFTIMFFLSGVKILTAWERAVILRLGRYRGIEGPGVIWIMPILDKIVLRFSIREQTIEIDTGEYGSADGHSRILKGVVRWKVVKEEKFALSIENHHQTVLKTIQHHVMKVAESIDNDSIFMDSEELNHIIEEALEPTFTDWGLKVIKVDLRTKS
jgi:regulator of protease activity HflC (stomatin/prohibitin superfamily)